MEYRNPVRSGPSAIDCEINLGNEWVPFTASPDDVEAYSAEIYAEADAVLPPWQEPSVEPAPAPTLNRAQWYVLLNSSPFGFILDAVISDMPDGPQKIAFKAVAYESESYSLANTLAIVAGMRAQGVSGLPTDAEIEAGWAIAAQFKGAADLLGGE